MIFHNYTFRWDCIDDWKKKGHSRMKSNFEYNYDDSYVQSANDLFFKNYCNREDSLIFITECYDSMIEAYVASRIGRYDDAHIKSEIKSQFSDCSCIEAKEITVEEYKRALELSQYYNNRRAIKKLNIDYSGSRLFDPCPYDWKEQILDLEPITREEAAVLSEKILGSKSLNEELDRIYSDKNRKEYFGHPVHYFVSAGDWGAAMDICELLAQALWSNGRLCSKRMATFTDFRKGAYRDDRYREHLSVSEGSIVVMELCCNSGNGRYASDFHEFTKVTGEILEEMKKDTLFIFVEIMGKSIKNADALGSIVSKADIIQLTEGSGTYKRAERYLTDLAKRSDIGLDDRQELLDYLPKQETFTVSDIFKAYNNWYGSGLKNHIYKAYRKENLCKIEVTKYEDKPYEDLRSLIGLENVKRVIDQIIAAGKVKCMRERMGLKIDSTSLNMLFAGSPGTAKTTVARLLAQILKEEDIIKSGKLVECGRQDLVGKYVGWTAKIIEDKFREAEGGVLFIDEAYSLVDDSNSYGAEAINTITQLIENYRDRVIVIFAGYPDKMKTFLEQNEGLRSRIAFHLNFKDYTTDELMDILELHVSKREYTLDKNAYPVITRILDSAEAEQNYGNGRYVRNLLEQAIIRQSERLLEEGNSKELTPEEMCLLKAEDFAAVTLGVTNPNEVKLGFAV
ncbi:MAG: AAA family ATPase [Ruminococcus sp.]|nr:AAA family ATPase [Ruminococcus sp.]